MMNFDKEKKEGLKEAYDKAVANGDVEFTFDGQEFYTDFAKYLLEYLDGIKFE